MGVGLRGPGARARTHTEASGTPRLTQRLPGECGADRVPDEGGRRRHLPGAERPRVAGWHGLAAEQAGAGSGTGGRCPASRATRPSARRPSEVPSGVADC